MPTRLFKYARHNPHTILLICLAVFYLALCITPFLAYGTHPLGYDTGFYRRYLISPSVSLPNAPVPGLDHTIIAPRIFLDAVRFLGLNPDISLYSSYILLGLFFIIAFYFFIKEYVDKKIALAAVALLVISPIQYTAYWFFLYKNLFGLIFFFLTFLFIKKRCFWLALASALIIPLSHQTTTILFLGILGGYVLLTLLLQKKFLIVELVILTLTLFTYLYLHPYVQQKIDAPPIGVFMEKLEFLLLTAPLFILALFGLPKFLAILKQNLLLIAFGIVVAIFPLFSLPYYQRVFLFSQYWLIIGASMGAFSLTAFIFQKNKFYKSAIAVLAGVIILNGWLLFNQVIKLKPLLTSSETKEVVALSKLIPDQSPILTTARFAPWAQGWTTARVYAPGIMKDQHPYWEWQSFWTGSKNEKLAFLDAFPKPLYIFVDNSQRALFVPIARCVRQITEMLYADECVNESDD